MKGVTIMRNVTVFASLGLCCWLLVGGCEKSGTSVGTHVKGAKICIGRVRRQVPKTEDFYGMQAVVDKLRKALVGLPKRIEEKEKTRVEECVARAKTAIEF